MPCRESEWGGCVLLSRKKRDPCRIQLCLFVSALLMINGIRFCSTRLNHRSCQTGCVLLPHKAGGAVHTTAAPSSSLLSHCIVRISPDLQTRLAQTVQKYCPPARSCGLSKPEPHIIKTASSLQQQNSSTSLPADTNSASIPAPLTLHTHKHTFKMSVSFKMLVICLFYCAHMCYFNTKYIFYILRYFGCNNKLCSFCTIFLILVCSLVPVASIIHCTGLEKYVTKENSCRMESTWQLPHF